MTRAETLLNLDTSRNKKNLIKFNEDHIKIVTRTVKTRFSFDSQPRWPIFKLNLEIISGLHITRTNILTKFNGEQIKHSTLSLWTIFLWCYLIIKILTQGDAYSNLISISLRQTFKQSFMKNETKLWLLSVNSVLFDLTGDLVFFYQT